MTEAEWKRIRSRIIRRDAYRCRVIECTVKGSGNLTVHHITPRDEGGGDYDANLITLCPKHHDQIEVAGVRIIPLIEAWCANVTSSMLKSWAPRQRRPRACIEVSPETAARLRERKLPGETWDETLTRLFLSMTPTKRTEP